MYMRHMNIFPYRFIVVTCLLQVSNAIVVTWDLELGGLNGQSLAVTTSEPVELVWPSGHNRLTYIEQRAAVTIIPCWPASQMHRLTHESKPLARANKAATTNEATMFCLCHKFNRLLRIVMLVFHTTTK